MYFGNLVTASSFDDVWLHEAYSSLIPGLHTRPPRPGFASLHESPVRKPRSFVNTISSNIHFVDLTISYQK
ncbi:hypothetical protein PENTCL1PPCAC_996, partial [Pristionchus entomophagus]